MKLRLTAIAVYLYIYINIYILRVVRVFLSLRLRPIIKSARSLVFEDFLLDLVLLYWFDLVQLNWYFRFFYFISKT